MRSDKAKNLANIWKYLLKNPLATTREVAEAVWIDHWTVARLLDEIPQNATKSEAINNIIEKDLAIVELATEILQERLKKAKAPETPEDKMSTRDIIASADVSAKRYSLFKWDITDKDWWYRAVSNTDLLDIADILD